MRVYVGGTFDLFHEGHVELLRRASHHGDVIAVLNTDAFATRYKRAPIMTLKERLAVVAACKHVTFTDVNIGCEDSRPTLRYWKPDLIAHGDDWKGDGLLEQLGIDIDWLEEHGAKMLYLPYTQGVSSSQVEERILQRYAVNA